MNLRHLKTFAIIAEAGGMAHAASRLNLSQPAASRQIQALEQELGVTLFDRIGRRLQLTAPGEDLLLRSRRLLADAELLGERARALAGGKAGLLRVGATPQMIESVLAGFLPQHRRRHGAVDVQLIEDGGAQLPQRLDRGELHLAVMPAGDERFAGRLLAPMHVLAVLPPSHKLAGRGVIEVAALADEGLVLLRREFGSRAWFDAACQTAGIMPHVLLESAAPHTLIALAAAGYGIAILPSNVRLPETGLSAVAIVHRGAAIGRWAMVGWNPDRFVAPHAMTFAEELAGYSRRAYPNGGKLLRAPPLRRPRTSLVR